jgi:DNA-binding NarL/FixJ family response regulator
MGKGENFYILEDHPIYLDGLIAYLKQEFPRCEIVGTNSNLVDARNFLSKKQDIDVAIVDLHLGDGRHPSEILSEFLKYEIPVLVLSAVENFQSIRSVFLMGAKGVVSKSSPIKELGGAIRAITLGRYWINTEISATITAKNSPIELLSQQELRACLLYSTGIKIDSIATHLGISKNTAKQYVARAKRKFASQGVIARNKTEMYKYLRDNGFII